MSPEVIGPQHDEIVKQIEHTFASVATETRPQELARAALDILGRLRGLDTAGRVSYVNRWVQLVVATGDRLLRDTVLAAGKDVFGYRVDTARESMQVYDAVNHALARPLAAFREAVASRSDLEGVMPEIAAAIMKLPDDDGSRATAKGVVLTCFDEVARERVLHRDAFGSELYPSELRRDIERRLDEALLAAEVGGKAKTSNIIISDTPLWPDPVDGAALLDALAATFTRFVILPPHTADVLALWVVFTHAIDAAEVAPLLHVRSPAPRCGKTRVLTLLGMLVARPLAASNLTGPSVFRVIEAYRPSLLMDEADSFLYDEKSELRGVLNSGHTRPTAYVIRVVGDAHEPQTFSTWGAKALAYIGRLPKSMTTLEDRGLIIPMRRRAKHEQVERLRRRRTPEALAPFAQQAARWCRDNEAALRDAEPDALDALNDRESDNWESLFAIADRAGGSWPERARAAARALAGLADEAADDGAGLLLLHDLREIFTTLPGRVHWTTDALLSALVARPESPWGEFSRGRPLTPRQLALLVRDFGARPRNARDSTGRVLKGYVVADFRDAFSRYLAASSATAADLQDVSAQAGTVTEGFVADTHANEKAHETHIVADVAADNGRPLTTFTFPDAPRSLLRVAVREEDAPPVLIPVEWRPDLLTEPLRRVAVRE